MQTFIPFVNVESYLKISFSIKFKLMLSGCLDF